MAALTRVAIAALVLASFAPAARAQSRSSAAEEAARLVAEGQRLYRELEFLGAIEVTQRALDTPGMTDARRAEALEVLGAAFVVLDREAEAQQAFATLFRLDPYHEVREPSGSPKIARFVAIVRAALVPDAALDPAIRLEAALPRAVRIGEPIRLRLSARPRGTIRRVRLFVRGAEGGEFAGIDAVRLDGAARFEAMIPARRAADELELYALGRDAGGRVVARTGSPLAPLLLPVRLDAPRETAGGVDGWLWFGVGAAVLAVAGAAVALALVLTAPDRAEPGTLPPGIVQLP